MKHIYPLCALSDFPFFKRLGRVFFLVAFYSAGYPSNAQINNYSQTYIINNDTTIHINVSGYLDGTNCVSLASNYFLAWNNSGNFCSEYIKAYEPLRELSFQNQDSQTVTGLSFYTNRYYYSNLDSLSRQIFANKVTSREKAMAIFYFIKNHHLYYFPGDYEAYDPTKFINGYGFGHCGDIANTTTWLTSLYTDTNQRTILVNGGSHAVSEVNFDSSWVYVDADQGGYYLLPDNKNMACFQDVYLDSYWYLRTKQFGLPLPYLLSQMILFNGQIRAGNHTEVNIDTTLNVTSNNFYVQPSPPLTFNLAPWDKISLYPADTISVAHYTNYPPIPSNNNIKPMIGKGTLVRSLINPEPVLNKSFSFIQNVSRSISGTDTILKPVNANQKAIMIFKMASPYPIVDAELNITAYLNSLNDSLKIFFSKDSLNWTAIAGTLQPGNNNLYIDLLNNIATTSQTATYNFYIRIELKATNSTSDCTIKLLKSTATFQYSRFSSPSFVLNNNALRVYTESSSPNLKMDLKWQENFSNMPPNAPVAPLYPLSGLTIDSSHFTFKWLPAIDPDGDPIKDYQIQVSDRADMEYTIASLFDRTLIPHFWGPVQSYFKPEVKGYLNHNTTYYWRVRALDNKGAWGPWSNVWSFKVTSVMYPKNVHFELYNNQTSDSFKLVWTPNANGKQPSFYKVYGSNDILGFMPDSTNFINSVTDPFYKVITAQCKQRYRLIAYDTFGGASSSSYFVNHPSNNMMKTGVYGDIIAPLNILAQNFALSTQPYPPASARERSLFCLYDTAYFSSTGNNQYLLKKAGKAFMNICTRINQDTVYLFQLLYTINKANLVITANNVTKAYGDLISFNGVTYSGFVNGENSSVLTTLPTLSTTYSIGAPVGTYTVTASGAVAQNYNITYQDGTYTVGKAGLVITANNVTKTYGDPITFNGVTYSGFANGEDTSVLTSLPALSTTYTNGNVGVYTVSASGANAENYNITYQSGTYMVVPAGLVVKANDVNIVYGDPITFNGVTYSGFVNGEDMSVLTSLPVLSTTYANGNVGVYTVSVSGATAQNYNISYQGGTYTVDKAALVITANNVTKTYGDLISFNGVTYSGFVNGEDTSVLTSLPVLSTTYSIGDTVGVYTVSASGAAAQNYDITYQDGTYTVGKADLVITANNVIKVYGDPISFNGVTYSGFVNGEDYTVLSLAPILTTTYNSGDNIGVYTVTAFGASATNYNITYQNGTYTVVPAGLIIRPNNVSSVYGDPVIFDGITYLGFVNDEDTSVLTTLPVINTTYTIANGVGTYALTASGASATNYTISYQTGVYKVDKAALTITANNVTKVYGDPVGFNGITYTGFVNGEDSSVLTTSPVLNTTYIAGDTADTYSVTVSGASAQNYDITYQDGTYTVGKAGLVITANNVDKTYGDPINFNGLTYTGFVNGEDSSVLTSLPELTTSYQEGNNVGTYSLTAAGANAVNYDITYQNGTYTVTKADLLITANDVYLTYGNPLNLNGVTYSGFVYGEDSSVLTTQPALTTNYSPGDPVNNYDIIPGGAVATNYNINYQNGTLYVSNANLWVVANDAVRTYGEQPLTNGYYYVGFVNGDTEDSLDTPPVITTTATVGALPGTYPITVSGASSPNYIIDYIDGTMQIDRAPLTITAKDTTSVYGSTPVLNGYIYNGFVLNENESVLTTPPAIATVATADSPVGNYLISIANATSERYLITFINGNLEVKRASLTIKPINSATNYGDDPILNGIMYSGFVNNDTADVLNELPVAETQVTRTSNAGTYPIIVGNASEIAADNYTIHFQEGVYQVNKKDLAFTANDTSKLFGDPMPPLQYQITGFVNNDNESHLDQLPTITTQATDNSVKGEYEIILQGGHDNNYEYQLVNGTMQVHPVLPEIALSLQKQDENVFSVSLTSTGGEILDLGIAWNIRELPTLESNENIATYGHIEDLKDEVSGQYDTVLAALQPNKVYYLRAYAKNSAGLVYSNTVELNTMGDDKIIVFPNPTAGAFTIWVPTQYIGSTINIFSMGGTLVKSIAIKNNSTFVQPGELAQGTYLLKIFKEGAPHDLAKSIKVVIR